ncbi:MAG TPA: pilus assembly protein PilM, partial [bacterium]|nr:pilus assembly protein PilM [bacterium]
IPKPGTETSSPEDQNKNPKLLKGMFAKPEIKPVPKPSLLKPGMPAKKLMGFGGEEQKDESKLKLNLPKPPGAPPQSLGAAAAGDVSISEEPGIDISSIDKKELFNTVRPLLDRLVIELRRSFDYFKTQLSGGQITKIILTGGSAKLNGLDVYLSKRLELPVEIFNPIERIETQNLNEKSHEYSVALGLGLRNIYDIFPININLIPDDITLRRRKVKQKKYLIIFFVLLILALGELGLFVYLGFQRKTNEANYLQTEYDKKYATILKEVNEVKAKKEGFEKVRGIIQNIQNEKAKWLDILRELSELLNDKFSDGLNTKNIWIETITFSEKSRISITGVAKSYDMIKNFIMRLGETKHFTPSQEPPSQQETIINEKKYYRFSLFADLKHNVVSEEAKPEGGAKEDGTENSEEVKSKENPQEEEPKTEAKPENKASEEDDDEGDE